MQTLTTLALAATAEDIYRFIKNYLDFEKLDRKKSIECIQNVFLYDQTIKHKMQHVCDQWRWKQRDGFGAFWLNLDAQIKIAWLRQWQFDVKDADAYLKIISIDSMNAMFIKAPPLVRAIDNVIMYFENHAIDEGDAPDISLPALAPSELQFGCATNWGRYITSLSPVFNKDQRELIESVRDYYPKNRLKNQ